MRVALASCLSIPEPDPDEPVVLAALANAGIDARVLAWDDESATFAEQDVVVLRSTWNYYEHIDEFVAWVRRVAKKVAIYNPPDVVAWNTKKTYLRDLDAHGVDVVPTEFVAKGDTRRMSEIFASRGWDTVVIKPTISAGSYRTERFDAHEADAAQAFLDGLTADRDAMVQRFMPTVNTHGERSLVYIDGEITHAIRKSPRFAGGVEQVSDEIAVADDERLFAERALAVFPAKLLYARVDVIRDDAGALYVMELELVEPSLYFNQCPRALDRFVRAIRKHGAA